MFRSPWKWLCAVLALFLVAACATGGGGQPAAPVDTFNKRLLVGYATIEGLAKAASELRSAGQLSEPDRVNVLEMSRTALDGMNLARTMAAKDEAAAAARLQVSLTSLQALQAYLLQKGARK